MCVCVCVVCVCVCLCVWCVLAHTSQPISRNFALRSSDIHLILWLSVVDVCVCVYVGGVCVWMVCVWGVCVCGWCVCVMCVCGVWVCVCVCVCVPFVTWNKAAAENSDVSQTDRHRCHFIPANVYTFFKDIWIMVDQLDDTCFIIYCSTCFRR